MTAETRQPIPPFQDVFPHLFGLSVEVLTAEQLRGVADALPETTRHAVAGFLGAEGVATVAQGLDETKAQILTDSYPVNDAPDLDPQDFAAVYPKVMVATNRGLDRSGLRQVMAGLTSAEVASQSLFLGAAGRREVFAAMDRGHVETLLDHTADWVLIETAKDALQSFGQYTALLEKRERVRGKLQKLERIGLKARQSPRAFYMKWGPGLFKGRELLYNEAVLGPDKLRVREAGLLGVLPVTLDVEGALSGRGTNHLATEVGLHHMVTLLEQDHDRAVTGGHLERINHGLVELDGRPVYKIESRLPRDPSLGYYCHRVVHYTDFLAAVDIKAEVYDFEDRLQEELHYRELDPSPGLTDADFDPGNRDYRL
jgi:Protein of unknown function (DUF1571)